MPDEQRKKLMRVDERPVAVDRSNAVAIAIGAQAGVEVSGKYRLPQRFDMRLDRLRMNAAKTRIARAANFITSDAITTE